MSAGSSRTDGRTLRQVSAERLRHEDVVVHDDGHKQTVDGDPQIENGDDVLVTFTDGTTAEFDSWAQVRALH